MKIFRVVLIPAFVFLSISSFGQADSAKLNQQEPWIAPAEADAVINPLKDNKGALRKGRVIYSNECVVCHGANGDGVSNIAKNLEQKPKNFTAEDFQTQSDGAIFWKLSEGRGLMQPFKTMLSDEEIWSVIEYVKFLAEDGK